MRIGELATRTGVSVRALRYYEEQHLLTSERSPSGQRHYPDTAVDRVLLIQCLYAAGLTSKTIRELLPCMCTGAATPAMLNRLTSERDRINAQIADLAMARDRLEAVIAAAGATADGETMCAPQSA
ncbi:MerR family transcriptional regulator [Streptomyces sp. NPDC056697]|uniref:MerR family transcriptional regulator n=1 Tax=Streptomyces sp. NPDC056697 TaxID=3345915 RepID=UPI0036759226